MASIVGELLRHLTAPALYDQNFGSGLDLLPSNFSTPALFPLWSLVQPSCDISGEHGFQVSLDVQQFKPEELSVKVKGNSVVVEGRHEEQKDQHGFVSRQFTRRYKLPDTVDSAALQASLSSDGVLQLQAPVGDAKRVEVPITKSKEATLTNGNCETVEAVNGRCASPISSPVQPALKKPRIEVDN